MATTNQHAKFSDYTEKLIIQCIDHLTAFKKKNLYSVLNSIPNQPKQRHALDTASALEQR